MRRRSARRPRPEPPRCLRCQQRATAGKLCEQHAAAHRASELRRQTRAAETGRCLSCGRDVQPWRDSHLCATCARSNSATRRRCSRCRQVGHRVETCTEPPAGWLAIGATRTEPLPCSVALSSAQRAEFDRELVAARAKLAALTEQLSALQAELERGTARVDQLTRALAGQPFTRDVAVEALADHALGVVAVVRLDTGEVIRERPMTPREQRVNREAA